jgi:hypothetical protein
MRSALLLSLLFILSGCGQAPSENAKPIDQSSTPTTRRSTAEPAAVLTTVARNADTVAEVLRKKYSKHEDFSAELANLDQLSNQVAQIKTSLNRNEEGDLQNTLVHAETRVGVASLEGFGLRIAKLFFTLSSLIGDLAEPRTKMGNWYQDTLKAAHELVDQIESLVTQKRLSGKLFLPRNLVPNSFGGVTDATAKNLLLNPRLEVLFTVKVAIESLLPERIRDTQTFVQKSDKKEARKSRDLLLKRMEEAVRKLTIQKPFDTIQKLEDLL